MPSYARVTNLNNHRSIVVRVNDRGPYVGNRVIDLSRKAAKLLGYYDRGLAKVKVDYIGRAPLRGSSDRELLATLREHQPGEARPVMVAANNTRDSRAYFDSRPMRELPPERPHRAESSKRQVVARADLSAPRAHTTELAAATRPRLMDDFKSLPPPVGNPQVSAVSAYASTTGQGSSAGFMSGRGLY